jgi:hypothetical protein
MRIIVGTGCLLGLIWIAERASAADPVVTGEALLDRPIDVDLDAKDFDRSLLRIAQATGAVLRLSTGGSMPANSSLPKRLKASSLRDGLKTILPDAFKVTPWRGPSVAVMSPDEARRPPEHRAEDKSLFRSGAWMVRGPVVDEAGQRLSRAMIRLSCGQQVVYTATDVEGRFAAQVPINGTSSLIVHAWDEPGIRQAWVEVRKEEGAIIEEPMTLVLRTPRTVNIQVTDTDGRGVSGASVVVLAGGYPSEAPSTDADGKSVFLAPDSMRVSCIVAWKPGAGLEIVGSESGSTERELEGSVDITQPIALQLTKRPPISFRIADPSDRPLEGIEISPFMLFNEKRKAGLNFATLRGRGIARTGSDGIARFDFLPEWQSQPLRFMSVRANRIRSLDETVDLAKSTEQPIKVVREEYVAVSGVVETAGGKPCPNSVVTAITSTPLAGGTVVSDEVGRYEIFLEPGHSYLIVARSDERGEVSAPQDGIVVRRDEPQRGLTLQLRRAIRLFGSLGAARMRMGRAEAQLRLVMEDQSADTSVPASANSPRMPKPGIYTDLKPNSEGQFDVLVGPGSYEIVPDRDATPIRFVLTDEEEYKLRLPPPPSSTRGLPAQPRPDRRPD